MIAIRGEAKFKALRAKTSTSLKRFILLGG
jgi:hypothetical protein